MLKTMDRGTVFMLLSALISALNGAIAKILSQELSALEIVFFRNLLGTFIILLSFKYSSTHLKGGKAHLLFLRGVFGFLAMILFFYTITAIPLAEAITLNKTSPFFVSILAFYLMNEKFGKKTATALIIGFLGVVFITKPFNIDIAYEHFLGVLGGFFAASAYITIKNIKDIYDARVIMLSFMGVGTLFPMILFFSSAYITPPPSLAFLFESFKIDFSYQAYFLIFLMAIISTASQWLLTRAYSLTKASIVGVISYANIPFAIGFGWMLGDDFPDFLTYLGIGLIVLGGLLVSREK